MQIEGWVNQGFAISLLCIAFIWSSISVVYWLKKRKTNKQLVPITDNIQNRPTFIMGDSKVTEDMDKKTKRLVVNARVGFTNAGDKAAYQVQIRRCYASVEVPSKIEVQPLIEESGPINVGEKIFVPFIASQPITNSKEPSVGSAALLIFCGLRYSDAPSQGNWYEYEKWLAYPVNAGALAFAKQEQKEAFEPFVRKAYSNKI